MTPKSLLGMSPEMPLALSKPVSVGSGGLDRLKMHVDSPVAFTVV